jgi:hypothetical protein
MRSIRAIDKKERRAREGERRSGKILRKKRKAEVVAADDHKLAVQLQNEEVEKEKARKQGGELSEAPANALGVQEDKVKEAVEEAVKGKDRGDIRAARENMMRVVEKKEKKNEEVARGGRVKGGRARARRQKRRGHEEELKGRRGGKRDIGEVS